VTSPSVPDLQP